MTPAEDAALAIAERVLAALLPTLQAWVLARLGQGQDPTLLEAEAAALFASATALVDDAETAKFGPP